MIIYAQIDSDYLGVVFQELLEHMTFVKLCICSGRKRKRTFFSNLFTLILRAPTDALVKFHPATKAARELSL